VLLIKKLHPEPGGNESSAAYLESGCWENLSDKQDAQNGQHNSSYFHAACSSPLVKKLSMGVAPADNPAQRKLTNIEG
jgi:hypothetical protein